VIFYNWAQNGQNSAHIPLIFARTTG